MKTPKNIIEGFSFKSPRALLAAGWLLLGGLGSLSPAATPVSPVGTWDLLISGAEQGIAYITFSDDFSLSGYEAITPTLPSPPSDNPRGFGENGRVITTTTSTGTTQTNFLGFAFISGTWSYDINGRVIGVLTEGNENSVKCTTNDLVTSSISNSTTVTIITNVDGSLTTNLTQFSTTNFFTNTVINCTTNPLTNALSFTASVGPAVNPSRITIKTVGSNTRTTLSGVPATTVPDISGSYYAMRKLGQGLYFTEFLTLTPSAQFFGGFDVQGQGSDYELTGIALLSSRKRLNLVTVSTATNAPLFSAVGPVTYRNGLTNIIGNLKGSDSSSTRMNYQMVKQPPVP